MKKLLLLFLLSFIVIFSFAQFPNYQPLGSPTTLTDIKGAARGIKGLINGGYVDTTAANADQIDFYPGAQIFTTSDDQIWVRDATATRWINITTGFTPTPACGLQSGTGIVTWDSLLVFDVSAAIYSLCCDNVARTTAFDSILLQPSDPTNPRYDAIILDATGVTYIKGVASANPKLPQLTDCQILLTYVLINAGDLVPADVVQSVIYDENYHSPEWYLTASGITADTANTLFTAHLTHSIDVGTVSLNSTLTFHDSLGTVSLNNYGVLKFYIRLKSGASATTPRFFLTFLNDGVQQTQAVLLSDGIYGFNKANSTSYQIISIPISKFNILTSDVVNELQITLQGSYAGFYLDWVQLQAGLIQSGTQGVQTVAGTGNALFDLNVANANTFPYLTFPLINAPAYKVWGNNTNATAAPSYITFNYATMGTGLLPVTNIAVGTANQVLTTIGGVATWTSGPTGYDTTRTINGISAFPGALEDTIGWGGRTLNSRILDYDTHLGLGNFNIKFEWGSDIVFLSDPIGKSSYLRSTNGTTSEAVLGAEADFGNGKVFFNLRSVHSTDTVNVRGDAISKKFTVTVDSILFKSTLSGATAGMVWKLKDATTGSGYWGTGASSLFIDARNGTTDSLGYVLLGGALYKATTVTAGVFAMNVNGSTGSFNSSFVSGGVTTSSNVSAGVGQFSTTQGSFSAIVSAVNGIVPITVTDGTKTSLLYTYPDSIINRSTDGIYKFYNMPSAVGTKAVRWDATTKQFTIADTTIAAGGGNTIYTGNGSIGSSRTVDLNGNLLQFTWSGKTFLILDPTVDDERVTLSAQNSTGSDNIASFVGNTSDIDAEATFSARFDGATKTATIFGFADATSSTLAYTAATHTFNGNVGVGSINDLFNVNDGNNDLLNINATTFFSQMQANNQTASTAFTANANLTGNQVYFDINANDGTNTVNINGDAIAQTITHTANQHIFNSDTLAFGLTVTNASATGSGISVNVLSSGTGVNAFSPDGFGVIGYSTNGYGVLGLSDNNYAGVFENLSANLNTVERIVQVERSDAGGTPLAGMGGSIDFKIRTEVDLRISNELISKWTNPTDATYASQFIIRGANAGGSGNELLTLNGNGSAKLNQYGSGTFTGTPTYSLAVDASGNLIERAAGVVASNRLTGQTGVASLTAYTVGASDASFLVSANILVTTATLHSFTTTVTYTDEGNTSRTLTLNFSTIAGAITPTIANAGGALPYEGIPLHIRCKASTTITIATTGTFTTVTYNFEQVINKLN